MPFNDLKDEPFPFKIKENRKKIICTINDEANKNLYWRKKNRKCCTTNIFVDSIPFHFGFKCENYKIFSFEHRQRRPLSKSNLLIYFICATTNNAHFHRLLFLKNLLFEKNYTISEFVANKYANDVKVIPISKKYVSTTKKFESKKIKNKNKNNVIYMGIFWTL